MTEVVSLGSLGSDPVGVGGVNPVVARSCSLGFGGVRPQWGSLGQTLFSVYSQFVAC